MTDTIQERAREAAEQVHFNASLHSSTENAITQIADDLTAFARAEVDRALSPTVDACLLVIRRHTANRGHLVPADIANIETDLRALKESGQ